MPLRTLQIAPGAPMTTALGRAIAELKAGDPLNAVTVLVGDHTHDASLRRALARQDGGIAAVDFVTVAELATRLASNRLVAENGDALKPVDGIALAGLVQQVLSSDAGVFEPRREHPATSIALARSIAELRDISPDGLDHLAATGDRSKDLVRIYREVVSELGEQWYDDALAIELATQLLSDGEGQLSPIIQLQLVDLSPREAAFVQAAAASTTVVTLAPELLELASGPLPEINIITTADAEDEVRTVVREVAGAIAAGTPAHRISLITTATEPYSRLLAERLNDAEIEFCGSTGRTVRELAPARLLLGLTGLDRAHVWRTELFGILASAPVADAGGSPIDIATWRSLAIDSHANGGLAHWAKRLTESDFKPDWKQERAKEFAEFVLALDADLAALDSAKSWTALIQQYLDLLRRYLYRRPLGQLGGTALAELQRILRSMQAFDTIGFPVDRQQLNELLELETRSRQLTQGKIGTGVRVLSLGQARGLDADLVIVLGCVEGMLPHRPPVEPLLHPDERLMLDGRGEQIRTAAKITSAQEDDFRFALGAAPKVIFTLPRGDLRKTTSRQPSRWVLEIARRLIAEDSALTFGPKELFGHQPDANSPVRNSSSFVSGLAQLAEPATAQEYRLRALEGVEIAESEDPVLIRNAQLQTARRSSDFTRFDGNLSGAQNILAEPFWLSATGLEVYLSCPHRFFFERILRIERGGGDDEGEFTAIERGNFIHAVLADHLGDGKKLRAAFDAREHEFVDAGRVGSPAAWRLERESLWDLVQSMAEREAGWISQRQLTVAKTEEKFEVDFGEGLVLSGYIDRADVGPDGAIHITDYKGKRGDQFKGITDDDPHAGNRKVQLTFYALVAPEIGLEGADPGKPVETRYTFYGADSTDKDLTLTLTEDQLDAARDLIKKSMDAARAGIFPAYVDPKGGTSYCPYCDEEGRGAGQVRREFLIKGSDPLIDRWLDLAVWARKLEEQR